MKTASACVSPDRLRGLLRRMVDIYSPSGKEIQLTTSLAESLHACGLHVTLRAVEGGRSNLEIVVPGAEPEVAFVGHIDTVPAYGMEQIGYREVEDRIYGLGTADMKGGCAAMIEAFLAAQEAGLSLSRAGLYLVVGEEETGDGAAALLQNATFPCAIVGEPTGLLPCLSHCGYAEMQLRTYGARRHAAAAGREHNAIVTMLQTLLTLTNTLENDWSDIIFNIRDLRSSESGFSVPDSCEAWVDLHVPPSSDPEVLCAMLKSHLAPHLASANQGDLTFPMMVAGYSIPADGWLSQKLQGVYRAMARPWQPGVFGSHSDANLLHEAGVQPVVLGPGHLGQAHTCDEYVPFGQVVDAAHIYAALLDSL